MQDSPIRQTSLQKLYSEDDVLQLVKNLKSEAEVSIRNAYDEGYKAGVLEYAPKLEAERIKREILEKESKKFKNQTIAMPFIIFASSTFGFCSGYAFRCVINL